MKPKLFLDLETTGLDAWRDTIHMCGLLDESNVYTAVRHAGHLEDLLRNEYREHEIVGHRTDFDIKFLEVQWGLNFDDWKIHDTRILGSLLRQRVPKLFIDQYEVLRKEKNKTLPKGQTYREGSPLSLKVMAPWYLKVPMFWETPGDYNNEEYNKFDLIYTKGLWNLLAPRIQEEGTWSFYENRMLSWTKMARKMETRGMLLAMDQLDTVEREYTQRRDLLKKKLDDVWMGAHQQYRFDQENELLTKYETMASAQIAKGKEPKKTKERYFQMYKNALPKMEMKINYSSPSQMTWLLRDHFGLNIVDTEGNETTDREVLNRLAAAGREDIKILIDYKDVDKILTMYVPTYQTLQINGVIHPSLNITGTRTGRTSCSKPNLQQVPSELYRLFIPRPGHKFLIYDLSGIEAALIALYSGDETLYNILENGESIHDHNAKALFDLDCPVNEVKKRFPAERASAKNLGFACFYGAGWRRIKSVFQTAGFMISDEEAKTKLKNLKKTYPRAFEFHKEITEMFEAGETIKNLFGRPITIQAHENAYMQGFNTLIQSSASDLNLRACEKAWKENGKAHPLIVIHDCIIQEVPEEFAEESSKILTEAMTGFKLESINGIIKLRVEGGISDIWEK